ncbi:MAG: hypothetical protein Q7K13_08305 [Polynucleobacter sp.]|uniref:hypothetical protein n=1 Tax=Polynucleobacter sp. TaxID=2029855 RepID=UPI002722046E|nr:hypothetical protein [Polynucleobacter sp.]MDO8714463.1 hypothetical protein [Polynucleobacter sp.]
MSRSRRKVPIFGIASARSEKQDKRIWHKRMRAQERTKQTALPAHELDAHLPVVVLEVSNIGSMRKDGRIYWSKAGQDNAADRQANRKARHPQERTSLKQRLIHKFMCK